MEKHNFIVGADIGGSHITSAIIDIRHKKVIESTRTRLHVNSQGTYAEILGTWADALRNTFKNSAFPASMIAIAMPGPFDYKNGISLIRGLHKYEAIYGLNIKHYLSTELNIEPENILFRNDAEAFLHGEVIAGAGVGFQNVIGITLGTGLGSAKSVLGITTDVNLGSSKFFESIADDYLSTRRFVKRYLELTGNTVPNVKELAMIADTDEYAKMVFDEFSFDLALFLKDFILTEDPDLLVIGGNITKASRLFLPFLINELSHYSTIIKIAELGEDAAIIGAAASFENIDHQSI